MDMLDMLDEDGGGRGGQRVGILGRKVKPDLAAKKQLDKKMTKTVRGLAADIAADIQVGMNEKYSPQKKAQAKAEFEADELNKRRKMRDTKSKKKRQGRTSRMSRMSAAEDEEAAEKARYDRMSIDEKAALARSERKARATKTGGMSEMMDVNELEEQDLANQATKVALTHNNKNTYKNSHTGIAKSMAGRNRELAPLSAKIVSYEGDSYINPDDMTLLALDDFTVNATVRNHIVPSTEIQTQGVSYFEREGKKRKGKRFKGDNGKDEMRKPRQTMMDKLKRAIRLTHNVNRLEFDDDPETDEETLERERKPRGSRMSRMAGEAGKKAGTAASEATLKAGTKTVAATGKATGFALRMLARATKVAIKVAAPHVSKGGSQLANFTMFAIDTATGERAPRMTKDERKQHKAAAIIQRNYKIYYHRAPDGPKYQRAARLITGAFKDYKHMIMGEKWAMIIKMEKRDKHDREMQQMRAAMKDDKKDRLKKQIRRANAEKAAKNTGWGGAASKLSKWTERDEAIMCACFFKHGFPAQDNDWPAFYQYFPEKARRAVRMKLNTMKDDGQLHNHKTVDDHISKNELEQLGLSIVIKKEKKKKAIDLKDLL
ncbi:hypothetical protein TL16_g06532 [Triparma laevis f. inornata]|uniref:Uncharacterized protein n=1 Tax=Triparma laevis f. inornata TaxID=1714386 RepID=A0A9W7AUM8_9STRA|nr:hypothetical protein TL16_g06532 [Triparma laevis f. inornata]